MIFVHGLWYNVQYLKRGLRPCLLTLVKIDLCGLEVVTVMIW